MNRRGFFSRLAGGATVAVVAPKLLSADTQAVSTPTIHTPPLAYRVPGFWAVEEVAGCRIDVCLSGVLQAMQKLGWSSYRSTKPTLVVPVWAWAIAIEIQRAVGGVIEIRTESMPAQIPDAWFVNYDGRSVGSIGL